MLPSSALQVAETLGTTLRVLKKNSRFTLINMIKSLQRNFSSLLQLVVAGGLSFYFISGILGIVYSMEYPDPRNLGGWNDFAHIFLTVFILLACMSIFWIYKLIRNILDNK